MKKNDSFNLVIGHTIYDYISELFLMAIQSLVIHFHQLYPGGDLTINPFTGELSWTASAVGNYVYTVVCEEYRNGLKIGEIRRDMQFIVLPNGNLPALSNLNNFSTDPNGIPLLNLYRKRHFNY